MTIVQTGLLADYAIEVKNKVPLRERPNYRVVVTPDACTLTELLIVVSGSEEAGKNLAERFGDVHELAKAHISELAAVPGVGNQMATRIKAALALGKQLMLTREEKEPIHRPEDAYAVLRPLLDGYDQERLAVAICDIRNRVRGVQVVYQGSVNSSQVRISELFRRAIQTNSCAIIMGHNHPSGDPNPSPEDISVTRAAVQAGKLLDIEVLDHIVVGNGRFVSLKEKGVGFR